MNVPTMFLNIFVDTAFLLCGTDVSDHLRYPEAWNAPTTKDIASEWIWDLGKSFSNKMSIKSWRSGGGGFSCLSLMMVSMVEFKSAFAGNIVQQYLVIVQYSKFLILFMALPMHHIRSIEN